MCQIAPPVIPYCFPILFIVQPLTLRLLYSSLIDLACSLVNFATG